MRLLNNSTERCLDDACCERETCLRWLQRHDGAPETLKRPTFTSHSTFGRCPAKITEEVNPQLNEPDL